MKRAIRTLNTAHRIAAATVRLIGGTLLFVLFAPFLIILAVLVAVTGYEPEEMQQVTRGETQRVRRAQRVLLSG